MGLLKKVLGGGTDEDTRTETTELDDVQCPHTALTTHWANAGDMGKPEMATYTCDACGATFTFEEAQQFLNEPPAVLLAASRSSEIYDDDLRR